MCKLIKFNLKSYAKFALVLSLISISQISFAETIWCKKLNLGCPAAEDIAKQSRICKSFSDETYQRNLKDALVDERLWKRQGYSSAHEYANAMSRLVYSRCMEKQ